MVKFRKDLVRTYTTVVDLTEEVNQLVLENMEYDNVPSIAFLAYHNF
jgi:hypothetical protein